MLVRPIWKGAAAGNFKYGRMCNGKSFLPIAIVIHTMAGTLIGTDAWFNNSDNAVSSHYGVGKSGEVHQYVKDDDTAYHVGRVFWPIWKLLEDGVNPNATTLGIEHEGTAVDGLTPAQAEASAHLISVLSGKFSIPLDADHVIRHREIYAKKTCPGVIDVEALIVRAQELSCVTS